MPPGRSRLAITENSRGSSGKSVPSANPEGTASPEGSAVPKGSNTLYSSKVQFVGHYRPTMFHVPLGHQPVKSMSMLQPTDTSILYSVCKLGKNQYVIVT